MTSPWEGRFRIRSYEVDAEGRALPRTITNYLQEAAIHHALALGVATDQLAEGRTWMLVRLRLEMERWPRWDDEVVVTTWPSDIERLFAIRDFALRDAKGEPWGAAISAWLVVDEVRRRPQRVPEAVRALRPIDAPRALEGGFEQLPEVETASHSASFPVGWSACDMNGHLNQAGYISWAIDALPTALHAASVLRSLEIEFLLEARPGDMVTVEAEADGDGVFRHRLRRDSDGRELARLRTRWAPA
ncbi:MAG: acyl-[acyl-carrier-protein] thioesterase [Planctomycetota bacterium]